MNAHWVERSETLIAKFPRLLGISVYHRLRAEGFTAQVIATSKVPTPACPEAKCDRLDCRKLALLASKGMLHPVRVPTEREEADRQLLRSREHGPGGRVRPPHGDAGSTSAVRAR